MSLQSPPASVSSVLDSSFCYPDLVCLCLSETNSFIGINFVTGGGFISVFYIIPQYCFM